MTLAANPVLQTALDFWRRLPQPVNIPDIRLLDTTTIPRLLLPHLLIAETTNADFDLSRLRLCGSEIARWFRELPDGMDARAYGALTDSAYMRHMRALMAELVERRKPIYCRSVYTLPGLTGGDAENIITAERLVLPLADGATAVECVIIVETLQASDSRAGPIRMLPPEPGIAVRHGPFEVAS